MINRLISQAIQETKKSILLLGPRQAGKSTLISTFTPDLEINLSDEIELLTYSSKPNELRDQIQIHNAKRISIDEVQRLPKLLNTVQALIDQNKQLKFYLTGSSARKLKRGGANLLPGRVLNFKLGPLVAAELDYKVNLQRALSLGFLPEIYLGSDPVASQKVLKSYVANYIKEEIKAEALTRNLEAFARFIFEISILSSQFIDYSKLAQRAKISRHSVPRYFEILEDTLIGQRIFPFSSPGTTEDLIKHPKFFFFDIGVLNSLLGNYTPSLDRIGGLAEHLVFNQILHSSWAKEAETEISTFRTRKGVEVDFIAKIDSNTFAIGVKSNDDIHSHDCEGLSYFSKQYPEHKGLFIFHLGMKETKMGKIWVLPWQKGLKTIGL